MFTLTATIYLSLMIDLMCIFYLNSRKNAEIKREKIYR